MTEQHDGYVIQTSDKMYVGKHDDNVYRCVNLADARVFRTMPELLAFITEHTPGGFCGYLPSEILRVRIRNPVLYIERTIA